ncbi:MAG TPA: hypothetical protein VK427_22770 [Kofleriaceae bacterium]|nr:hypothetical protein [Kofleriaceae bacterium]
MAAAVKASGPADARIPCPLCGGLIHPIAGRCKHCKGDVGATRSARPAAATSLPALQGGGHVQPYVGNANVQAPHPANAHMAVPIAMRVDEAIQTILPPRPTGTMRAPAPPTWRSWPVVVIAIAVLAIITAVILMVWPASTAAKADAKMLAPPPAPERMETNPVPPSGNGPQGGLDPWKAPNGAAPDPSTPPAVPDPSNPMADLDDNDVDPPNLADPHRDPLGGFSSQKMLGLMGAIAKHACDRLESCPNAADPMVRSACDVGRLAFPNAPPPSCSAAQRCLAKIDALPCDDIDPNITMGMVQGVQDCIEAMRC